MAVVFEHIQRLWTAVNEDAWLQDEEAQQNVADLISDLVHALPSPIAGRVRSRLCTCSEPQIAPAPACADPEDDKQESLGWHDISNRQQEWISSPESFFGKQKPLNVVRYLKAWEKKKYGLVATIKFRLIAGVLHRCRQSWGNRVDAFREVLRKSAEFEDKDWDGWNRHGRTSEYISKNFGPGTIIALAETLGSKYQKAPTGNGAMNNPFFKEACSQVIKTEAQQYAHLEIALIEYLSNLCQPFFKCVPDSEHGGEPTFTISTWNMRNPSHELVDAPAERETLSETGPDYASLQPPCAVDQCTSEATRFPPQQVSTHVGMAFVDETHILLQRPRTPSREDSIIRPNTRTSLVNPRCAAAVPFAENEFAFQPNRTDVRRFLSDPHSPSPLQALLVPENLFRNIKAYFEISCRNMIFDDLGNLLTSTGAKFDNALCSDFDSYCFTATMFMEKGLGVEFRRSLSKASALVEQILRAEHPRSLSCFLEVFIHLIQTGLREVTSYLCDYIKRMSVKVIREYNPWGQICRLLGDLEPEFLDQAMVQIWKCTTDVFDGELGPFNRLAVSIRLDYIKRTVTAPLDEERLLRDLLDQFGGTPRFQTPRVMLNLAHNLNKQGRYNEAEKLALEVLSLLHGLEIYAGKIVERIESLKIISRSQFHEGNRLKAEQTMRKAIQLIIDQWGIQHSWVPEFMSVLEGWLQTWGRKEDAANLRGEIEKLMGKDEIDEQLDGAQYLL